MPSFAALRERLVLAVRRLDGALADAGTFEDQPIVIVRAGARTGRPLLVTAGIHGEEPASALGFIEWLERDAAVVLDRIALTALPCLNPVGFERGTRGSRDCPDLNRRFDDAAFPLTRIVTEALAGDRYDLAADLHEDSDFLGAYCYELKSGPPFLAERVLAAAAAHVPVSDGDAVGDFVTRAGVLRPDPGARREVVRRGGGLPIGLWMYERVTPHTVTFEAPGARPLPERIAATRAALRAAATFLLS